MNELFEMTAIEIARGIRGREFSAPEVTKAYIDAVKSKDKQINAFISVCESEALARADEIQSLMDSGRETPPLAGVPVALKDNISIKGLPTTCSSRMLERYTPVFNATVADKTEDAGLVIIGKLNMDEFAMGGSSETGASGIVKNPWDTSRVAGGSSGGSAAAVASLQVPFALGSDTGGSIRQPCAFCGVTGIKPTYGAVSRYGLIAYASSLDQIGTVARDINDCAELYAIISGPDKKDSTSVISEPFRTREGSYGIKGARMGIPRNYFESGIDPDVKQSVLAAAEEFAAGGAEVSEFEMPLLDYFVPAYYVIACAEASSNLSRYDGLKFGHACEEASSLSELYRMSRAEGFGMEVKRRIMLGAFVLSSGYYDAYYKKALEARAMIKDAYNNLFRRYDMILSPVAPTTAYKIGRNIEDPMKMYMGDIYTVSVNLAGLPAVSLPCGFDSSGLPIGFQLIGDTFNEETLINASVYYQNATDHHKKRPRITAAEGGGAAL